MLKHGVQYFPADRHREGLVLQRSLKENIILGRKYDANKWKTAIHYARLDNFLKKLKYGPDESIGENGIRLSGGERQRILIASAKSPQNANISPRVAR